MLYKDRFFTIDSDSREYVSKLRAHRMGLPMNALKTKKKWKRYALSWDFPLLWLHPSLWTRICGPDVRRLNAQQVRHRALKSAFWTWSIAWVLETFHSRLASKPSLGTQTEQKQHPSGFPFLSESLNHVWNLKTTVFQKQVPHVPALQWPCFAYSKLTSWLCHLFIFEKNNFIEKRIPQEFHTHHLKQLEWSKVKAQIVSSFQNNIIV